MEADPAIRDTVTRRWYKDGAEVGEELLEGDSVHISYLVTENTGEYRWVSLKSMDTSSNPLQIIIPVCADAR